MSCQNVVECCQPYNYSVIGDAPPVIVDGGVPDAPDILFDEIIDGGVP